MEEPARRRQGAYGPVPTGTLDATAADRASGLDSTSQGHGSVGHGRLGAEAAEQVHAGGPPGRGRRLRTPGARAQPPCGSGRVAGRAAGDGDGRRQFGGHASRFTDEPVVHRLIRSGRSPREGVTDRHFMAIRCSPLPETMRRFVRARPRTNRSHMKRIATRAGSPAPCGVRAAGALAAGCDGEDQAHSVRDLRRRVRGGLLGGVANARRGGHRGRARFGGGTAKNRRQSA
jgi:hypothetical protein